MITNRHTTLPGDGRTRLLDTAEVLFDQHGLDGTSARAIAAAAGHRNVAAVRYHFGGQAQLLAAVLARRAEQADTERHRLLDALEAAGDVTPRAALVALVEPLVQMLTKPDGRRYVRLLNQAANHPTYYTQADLRFASSLARAATKIAPLVEHLDPPRRAHRTQLCLGLVLYALAEQSRLLDTDQPHRQPLDHPTFTQDLVDTVAAALAA